MPFSKLKKQIGVRPKLNMQRIREAYDLAEAVHKNQKRRSGEPFILHPVEVASIIYRIGGDENMICAALLHDVLEDAEDRAEMENEIYKKFGVDVFFLVQAVSKDLNIKDHLERQEEYFKRMKESFHADISVFFLKMADLVHNLSTLKALKKEKQEKWITELKQSYIPMLQSHFHEISFHYHDMYSNLMNEMESVVDEYEKNSSQK